MLGTSRITSGDRRVTADDSLPVRKTMPRAVSARHIVVGCAPSCEATAATDRPEVYNRTASSTFCSDKGSAARIV